MTKDRQEIIGWINQAQSSGARQSKACEIVGFSRRTLQRWRKSVSGQDGRIDALHFPPNKLTDLERQHIINIANSAGFSNLPPGKIVPRLADQGKYMASESTFYRVLKAVAQLNHRHRSKPARKVARPRSLTATAPNQIYTWDITWLPTSVKGIFIYLYVVLDIYSRKIVGWQVHDRELSSLAADLMVDICLREGIQRHQVTLHSDNGSPMKGATMLATLHYLGVTPSFSRPSVSNDNPYSEAAFRTLKYQPDYPAEPFSDIPAARNWTEGFVDWYNNEHLHSGIKFVTPAQRHEGKDTEILDKRKQVYLTARSKNPNRWSGNIRNWDPVTAVHLNPEKAKAQTNQKRAA